MTRFLRAAWGFLAAALVVLAAPACATSDAPRRQVAVAAQAAPAPYFSGPEFAVVGLYKDCQPVRVQPDGKHARCPIIVNGHQYYGVQHTYSLHLSDGTVLTVPAGMTTDLASVPKVFWSLLPPDGPYGKAAGVHDECFRTLGSFVWRWPSHPNAKPFIGLPPGHPPLTFDQCNDALRQGMVALQVPSWQRVVVFEAVQLFGRSSFGH